MTTLEVALLAGLMVLNAFLAMARTALVNVRKARLKQLAEDGVGRAQTADRLAEDSGRLLASTKLGMMMTSAFAGALVAVVSGPELARLIQPMLGRASGPVAFALVVFLTALVMLIVAQLVPEAIAVGHSERVALWLARPLAVFQVVSMPFVHVSIWLSGALSRLLGVAAQGGMPLVTEEEIKTLVDAGEEGGVIQEEEKQMIYSIFELGDTLAREVMVPRIDVVALDLSTPMLEALDTIMEAGHSRIPVYSDTIDNIQGVLYAKDLLPYLRSGETDVLLQEIMREAYFVPETKKASDLLPDLQQRRVHMAVVVDEYGGMAGLVTIEDLVEEIVGEIQDEYDSEEPFVELISDSEFLFDARVDLDDLNRLMDVDLPTEDSDTLAGFIYTELGKVPEVGDQVTYHELSFTVESVSGRRIKKVRVERVPVPAHGPEAQGSEPGSGNGHRNGTDNGKRRWGP